MAYLKRLILTFSCACVLGGLAFAQDLYGGGSLGVDFVGGGVFNIDGYLGFDDALAREVDVRTNLGLLISGSTAVKLGGDVLFSFVPTRGGSLTINAGGGPRLLFGGGTNFALGFLGNVDYALQSDVSLFGEFDLDIYLVNNARAVPGLDFGVMFKF